MSKKRQRIKKSKKLSGLDILKSIRKPMPPPTRVLNPKQNSRQDKSWMEEE